MSEPDEMFFEKWTAFLTTAISLFGARSPEIWFIIQLTGSQPENLGKYLNSHAPALQMGAELESRMSDTVKATSPSSSQATRLDQLNELISLWDGLIALCEDNAEKISTRIGFNDLLAPSMT